MVSALSVQIPRLIGRSRESQQIARLLAQGTGSLVLQGDPGLGKTALLDYATGLAAGRLVTRYCGYPDEATLPYATLGFTSLLGRLQSGEVCLVDDLHWADDQSRCAIIYAARRVASRGAIMLLSTSGPNPAGLTCLRLNSLTGPESLDLLASTGVPAGERDEIANRAHGNPQALLDLASQPYGSRHTLAPGSRLRETYLACLDRLPESTRWLLVLAAAEEVMDTATLLQSASLSGLDILALVPAEKAALIRSSHGSITFSLPLLKELVYDEAPLAQRRAAHLLLAKVAKARGNRLGQAVHRACAAAGPDSSLALELEEAAEAGGYERASAALEQAAQLTSEPAGAARRLVSAAQYAWLSGSPHRARTLLSSAHPVSGTDQGRRDVLAEEIELRSGAASSTLEPLLATADRFGRSNRGLAITALLRASEAVCFSGEYERFPEIAHRAGALAAQSPGGREDRQWELILAYLTGLGATFVGRHLEAATALAMVSHGGGETADPAALTCASAAALLLADDHRAHQHAVKAGSVARAQGDAAALPLALEMQACAEYWLGRYDCAEATSREGLALAHSTGQENYAGDHLAMLAVLTAIRGERRDCLDLLRSLAVSPGAGPISRPAALSRWARAVLDLIAGRPDDALARLASIANPVTGTGHVVVQSMATPWLVEAAVRSGDPGSARAAHAAFGRWAGATGDPVRQALAARCSALLAPRGSDGAEEHFRQALRLHLRGEADFERARTELLFGQELRRCRRSREAREHLHLARETFQQLALPAWVAQADAELRAAGEAGRDAADECANAAEMLTAQQFQIARLVAAGATNREVAAQLFLSPRTVDHHMRNIFTRLGIRSRIELTRVV
jgi:DNA-binding NarL/FixJ family response regulator